MAYQKLTPILADGSTEPRYLGERFAETVNVKDFGAKGDGVADDTAAIRDAFDYALSLIQTWRIHGAIVFFPAGTYTISDEMLSDDFQKHIWEHSYGERHLTIQGDGSANSVIYVSSNWESGVRNTANGNQRDYGPWANSPSPSIVLPIIQDKTNSNPLTVSVKSLRFRKSSKIIGRDPIPFFVRTELDARHSDIEIMGFANWGEVVMGSFNSNRQNIKVISCGQQPSECGKIFTNVPAGFNSSAVVFDFNSSTGVVSAKAASPCQGYETGASIPFFKSEQIGKVFWLADCDQNIQPLKTVISSIGANGYTATVTVSATYGTPVSKTGVAGSFTPVKVTTSANSTDVVLSAPISFGRGARDMVGMMIAIPNAGSSDSRADTFVSRIAECLTGNDTDGYTELRLTEPVKYAVTGEDFITSASHFDGYDERAYLDKASHVVWNVNDTDYLCCQWENSIETTADTQVSSAYMFISLHPGTAIQAVSCKIHGWNPVSGQFACDGSVLIENSSDIDFIGVNVTHHVCGKGAIRFVGKTNFVRFVNINFDSWKIPKDWSPFYFDPQPQGWTKTRYRCVAKNVEIQNVITYTFWNKNQYYKGNKTNVSSNDIARIVRDSDLSFGMFYVRLYDDEDLNDIKTTGSYWLDNPKPANSPLYATYAFLEVLNFNEWVYQKLVDLDNQVTYERYRTSQNGIWTWSPWRATYVISGSNANFLDKTSFINNQGKSWMSLAYNSNTGKVYVALGANPTSSWKPVDGGSEIVPS